MVIDKYRRVLRYSGEEYPRWLRKAMYDVGFSIPLLQEDDKITIDIRILTEHKEDK